MVNFFLYVHSPKKLQHAQKNVKRFDTIQLLTKSFKSKTAAILVVLLFFFDNLYFSLNNTVSLLSASKPR